MSKVQTRVCRICGKEKPLVASFYKKERAVRGYSSMCKGCHCAQSRIRLRESYDPEKARQKYLKRKRLGKDIINSLKMREKYPEKFEARMRLRNATYSGKVKKLPCEVCGDTKSEAHHPDYSKPFEVVWLCRKHHGKIHRLSTAIEIINHQSNEK